jgi:hypothetical protein
VGRASALLSRRTAAFVALGAAVGAYYVWSDALPDVSTWTDVALLAFPIMPAVLGLLLIALPLQTWRGLLPAAVLLVLAAYGCQQAGWDLAGNFAKLWAATFFGWWFLTLFEAVSWVVIVACLIPLVDAISVWRGPTHTITTKHEHVYTSISIAFPAPHEGAARLGPPDVLFFALFLGAADRFGLRVVWTWILMTLSFGVTVVLANAFDVSGLPALPLLSAGFLLANADLLWKRWRERPRPAA